MAQLSSIFRTVQLGLLAAARCAVGGQAVIEGVLMRSPRAIAIAVRKPDGSIAVKDDEWHSISERVRILKVPLLRGVVMLFETLANGYQALSYSAWQAYQSEETPEGGAGTLSSWALAGTMLVALGFAVLLFVVAPQLTTSYLGPRLGFALEVTSYSFQLMEGAVKLLIFVTYLWLVSRMRDIQRVFQYHGAEHKSIHVFEHAEPLDVEHTRKWPRLHPRCGTTFLFFVVVVSVLVHLTVFPLLPSFGGIPKLGQNLLSAGIKVLLLLPVSAISYEIIRLAGRFAERPGLRQLYQPMMILQRLTTAEPDDRQIEVALAALKATLAREERIHGGPVLAERAVL